MKIYKATSMLLLSTVLIFLTLFSGLTSAYAIEVPGWVQSTSTGKNVDNSLGIVIEPSRENQLSKNGELEASIDQDETILENYPDLGDDQVFPFVAGLDSYESMSN